MTIKAINWNRVPDEMDSMIWDRLVTNFWVPERVPLSNDIRSWETLTRDERAATIKVFAGLTLLDTLQGSVGAISLIEDAKTLHEEAVYCNQAFMEQIHAKSYSSIFSTLCSSREIDEAFHWAEGNKWLQAKARRIQTHYEHSDPATKKIASVMLESFLFYSGFFMPMYWSSRAKLTNTADLIRLIIRDEAVHGYYIGYKFQQIPGHERFEKIAQNMIRDLYDIEVHYAREIYDPIGLTPEVVKFLKYNANKAMANLGFGPAFPESETRVMASVLSALDPGASETFDFFSGAGSNYVIGNVEDTTDDDWG